MPRENEIGALWLKRGAKGEYMTGTVNGTKVVLFPVMDKHNDKQPDWRIFLSVHQGAAASVPAPQAATEWD